MPELRRHLAPAVAVTVTLAFGWWLAADRDQGIPPASTAEGDQPPKYYATQATVRRYEPSGRLAGRISAQRLDYVERTDVWALKQPRWQRVANDADTRAWWGRGDRGELRDQETVGYLRSNVVLTTPGRQGPIRLHTNYLRIEPKRDYAETDARVRIEAPHWQQHGTGGQFWLGQQRFNLLAETEAVYDTPSSEP